MNQGKSDNLGREQRILDAAAELIIHYGYDKTSVGEIADVAGISKGAIYLHFASKDELFEALLHREVMAYLECWLARIEADPQGGTIGGIYKAVLYAIHQRPFMSAIVKQDPRVFGNYLRKPKTLFTSMQSPSLRTEFLQAMQAAGAIRPDVKPPVMSHIMDMLSYGLVGINEFKAADAIPPFDEVLETIAEMMDRMLTPTADNEGSNHLGLGNPSDAGKAVIRELAVTARQQLEAVRPINEDTNQ
ncbi:MAG: TetR/AcrR family transcriptional regulator [Caldilineaceae bacterium]|nr:TetR/AcrR family transcriptional regulator [Caldilineaceae bacterium]